MTVGSSFIFIKNTMDDLITLVYTHALVRSGLQHYHATAQLISLTTTRSIEPIKVDISVVAIWARISANAPF